MFNDNDFDLDLQIKSNTNLESSGITSKSLCTPGCKTGPLHCNSQYCPTNSCTCGCHVEGNCAIF